MMIDINVYDNLTSQNRGLFSDIIVNPIITQNYRVRRHPNELVDRWLLTQNMDFNTWNICMYGVTVYADDHVVNLTHYANQLLDTDFNSILIAGLKLGLIPYVCNNAGIETDVIESSQELIDTIQPMGYLTGVNIIKDDVYNWTPTKQYDIILLDLWTCDCGENFETEMANLISKYNQYLNYGGIIYVPINKNGQKVFSKVE